MPATYDSIATTTLSASTATINFTSIPQTYTDLRLVLYLVPDGGMFLSGRFNSSSALEYSSTYVYAKGSGTATATQHLAYTFWQAEQDVSENTVPTLFTMDIFNYSSTSIRKTSLQTYSQQMNVSSLTYRSVDLWNNTSAINSLSLSYNFSTASLGAGTTATLYGIKAA
jgi:hypothetical protein